VRTSFTSTPPSEPFGPPAPLSCFFAWRRGISSASSCNRSELLVLWLRPLRFRPRAIDGYSGTRSQQQASHARRGREHVLCAPRCVLHDGANCVPIRPAAVEQKLFQSAEDKRAGSDTRSMSSTEQQVHTGAMKAALHGCALRSRWHGFFGTCGSCCHSCLALPSQPPCTLNAVLFSKRTAGQGYQSL